MNFSNKTQVLAKNNYVLNITRDLARSGGIPQITPRFFSKE